jgi:hypothetical protein
MRPQIRTWLNLLVIIGLLSAELTGCKKDNTNPDFAGAIAGTYTGTITASGIGSVSASTTITKVNETTVNFVITIGGTPIPLDGITVSNPSGNTYALSLSDSSGNLTGTVIVKTLNFTLTSGTDVDVFTGTR